MAPVSGNRKESAAARVAGSGASGAYEFATAGRLYAKSAENLVDFAG